MGHSPDDYRTESLSSARPLAAVVPETPRRLAFLLCRRDALRTGRKNTTQRGAARRDRDRIAREETRANSLAMIWRLTVPLILPIARSY